MVEQGGNRSQIIFYWNQNVQLRPKATLDKLLFFMIAARQAKPQFIVAKFGGTQEIWLEPVNKRTEGVAKYLTILR